MQIHGCFRAFRNWIKTACLATLALAAPAAAPPAPLPQQTQHDANIEEIRRKLAAFASIDNTDSSIRVAGNAIATLEKQTVLLFAEDVRSRLETTLAVSFKDPAYRLLIAFEEPSESSSSTSPIIETFYAHPSVGRDGFPAIRIRVQNSAALDPRALASALAIRICEGYLSMRILSHPRRAPDAAATKFPPWFPAGIARGLDFSQRQADAERALALWQRGALPPLWRSARAQSPLLEHNEHIAAQLAAYWLSFPQRGARLDQLCGRLAAGAPWTPRLFAETARPESPPDILRADMKFDNWLLSRRDTVLTPGATAPAFAIRAWRAMFLDPGEDGVPLDIPPATPLPQLIRSRDEAWVKDCATKKTAQILRLAAGRGDKFHAAAAKYVEFFNALSGSAKTSSLLPLLAEAEHLLSQSADPAPAE